MISIPKKVEVRFSKSISHFQKILAQAKDRDVNESDTVTIVKDMLADVFGYDKYSELTSEQAIHGTYCDLAVKVEGKTKFLIEVKAIGLDLKENHLRQAVNYGANHGIPWVVLTNGATWEIHRIKLDRTVTHEQVCILNFQELNPRKKDDQDKLFLLCKEGLSKAAIDKFHEHIQSVNRFIVGALIQSEPVIADIRRLLRKMSPGTKVKAEEIHAILEDEVLKRDVVNGEQANAAMKSVKKLERNLKR